MISIVELLNAARQFGPVQSDYRLARDLGVSDQSLYNYRHLQRIPTEDVVVKLAAIAKMPAPYVLVCMAAARAKEPEVRAAFEAAARALAGPSTPPGADKTPRPPSPGLKSQKPADSEDSGFGAAVLSVAQSIHRGKYVEPQSMALAALGAVINRRQRLKQRPISQTPIA